MKKLLSIVTIMLLLVLAACTPDVKSNARATVSSYSLSSQSASFRVEVKDPDNELDNRLFDIMVIDSTGKESKLEDKEIQKDQLINFTFENLERTTDYTVVVNGTKDGQDFQLAKITNAFKTLAQGDVEVDPILIYTTDEFISIKDEPKKHYRLANDLDFNGSSFTPLFASGKPFNGTFDGNNKTIKNINLVAEDDVNKSYLSIFGYASKSKIKNVVFDNIKIDNDAKNHTGIHYVGIVVSKVSNNEFEMENITISNSSVTIKHNINKVTTNRNLYAGLVGGSLQGKLSKITVSNSVITVNQSGVNGIYNNGDIATSGTYVGGVVGLMEQDKGFSINQISVLNTEVNVNINQDKKGNGSGLIYVGGIFGANRSDRGSSELVSNAKISVTHVKYQDTEASKMDVMYIGGISGNLHKSNLTNAYFGGSIEVETSDSLKGLNVGLITAYATKSASKVVSNGSLTIKTANNTQENAVVEIYNYISSGTWNRYNHVKFLTTPNILVDETVVTLDKYQGINQISDLIDSQYVLSNYNK